MITTDCKPFKQDYYIYVGNTMIVSYFKMMILFMPHLPYLFMYHLKGIKPQIIQMYHKMKCVRTKTTKHDNDQRKMMKKDHLVCITDIMIYW